MKLKRIGKIRGGQDGAILGSELFRFDHRGNCAVYALSDVRTGSGAELCPIATFVLDRSDVLAPHSNAVCFGRERYEVGDRYPLLYTNIYNNRAGKDDPMLGVTCVYRIERTGDGFRSTLVQLIKIGFCEDPTLWRATPEQHGSRPYGNLAVDPDSPFCYAFVMRNEEKGTRYFTFTLPSVHDGEYDRELGVRRVTLGADAILAAVDCPYHRYIQGAAVHRGLIYSTEGFTASEGNRPAIRIVDPAVGQLQYIDLMAMGIVCEPEFIDFDGDDCYYSDYDGNLYQIDF